MSFPSLSNISTFEIRSFLTQTTLNHIGSILTHENVKELILSRSLRDIDLQILAKFLSEQKSVETLSLLSRAIQQHRYHDTSRSIKLPVGDLPSDEELCQMLKHVLGHLYLGQEEAKTLDELIAVSLSFLFLCSP
jgi:hypothetical protein